MADEEGGTVVVVTANDVLKSSTTEIKSSKATDDSEILPTLETISTWPWPEYDEIYDRCGQKTRLKRKRSSSADEGNPKDKEHGLMPFHVVYQHRKGMPWAERVKVTIYSRTLLKTLGELIPDGDFNSLDVNKKTKVWVKDLFHIREKLREKYAKLCSNNDGGPEGQLRSCLQKDDNELLRVHLSVLLRFMDKEFEGPVASYSAMKEQRRVSWDMVWAFFPPGEKIVYQCEVSDEEACGVVLSTEYDVHNGRLVVHFVAWDYNGKSWSKYSLVRSMNRYEGDFQFTDLREICPLAFTKNPVNTEKGFLERGDKFCWLSMMGKERYMNYKGPIFILQGHQRGGGLVKENADGRVMVDLGSFARMNPDYKMDEAKPPTSVFRDKKVEVVDISGNPNRVYAPAIVYGFSFRLKKWGTFSIMGFEHITFNDAAFDALVMDPMRKELIYGLVGEYIKKDPNSGHVGNHNDSGATAGRVDPIANKGEGCIILCYGPPGTGKTLTAESIAERLHCPLWSLSVSELGTNPSELETTLVKVLEVAASWRAVLLLDEADVYLERRASSDLIRNAMTGIFLRELEYYRGVLFLTTNRVVMFDDAFCSRISMFMHYEKHDKETRATIWKTLLQRLQWSNVQEDHTTDIDELSAEFSEADFNGREIRNIVQTAMTLARSKGEALHAQHLRKAWTVLVSSMKELKAVQSQMPMLLG